MSYTLYKGDCLEEMKKIPDGSVDMILTSPPYDDLRSYNNSLEWGPYIWEAVIGQAIRVLKEGGVMVWIVNDATIKGSESGNSFRQALFAMEAGFNLHDTMIWEKSTFSAVGALRSRYAPVFEYMFVFSKGRPVTFNPIKDKKNITFGRSVTGTVRQKDGSTKPIIGANEKKIKEYGQRFNVWRVTEEKVFNKLHPAVFPVNLANDHIVSWTDSGETVLDMFAGSGTTGVACANTGRKFIGIERDEKYFDIAKSRIEQAFDGRLI